LYPTHPHKKHTHTHTHTHTHHAVTHLNLSNCGIDSAAALKLGDAISHCPPLKTLILHGNPLGDAGIINIAQGILRGSSQGRTKAVGMAVWAVSSSLAARGIGGSPAEPPPPVSEPLGGTTKEQAEEKIEARRRKRGLTVEVIEAAKARGAVVCVDWRCRRHIRHIPVALACCVYVSCSMGIAARDTDTKLLD
jgi:hypothetical protein